MARVWRTFRTRSLGGLLCSSSQAEFRIGVAPATVRSVAPSVRALAGRLLIPGLPAEFAQPVLDGVMQASTIAGVAGLLMVDRAAYDPVDSSRRVFLRTSEVLYRLLVSMSQGHDRDIEMPLLIANLID